MKKFLLLFVAIFTTVFVLVSCGSNTTPSPSGTPCETHTFSEWTVVKAPTEKEKGSAKRTCSVCNEIETLELPVLSTESYTVSETSDVRKASYQLKTNEKIVIEVVEHHGEIFCEDCGKDLTTDEFWENMSDSSKYNSLTASIDKLELNVGPIILELKNANLEIDFNNGSLSRARGFVTKVDETTVDGAPVKKETEYYFDFEDLVLYTAEKKADEEITYDSIDFKKKADGTQLTTEEETVITNSILTRENIVKALYYLTKVTKNTDGTLVVNIDWEKVKGYNKDLSEKSVNEILKSLLGTDVSALITTGLPLIANLTYSDIADSFEEQITQLEGMINIYLAMIPQGMIPENVTTLTDLLKHFVVQFGIATAEKVANAKNFKELLLAIDPSTETTKVTVLDMLLNILKVEPVEGKSSLELVKEKIKGLITTALANTQIDPDVVYGLFEEKAGLILTMSSYISLTDAVSLIDGLIAVGTIPDIFGKFNELEAKVNEYLAMSNALLPLDTSSIANLVKGLLVKTEKITIAQAEEIDSIMDIFMLFDKSTETERYTLDKILVDMLKVTKQEGETETAALIRVAKEFLNKTPYKLLIDSGIITKITTVDMDVATLKRSVDAAIETVLKTSFVPTVTFNADGTIKACGLKLDLGSTISFNLQIAINQQIEMIDIRNVVAAA